MDVAVRPDLLADLAVVTCVAAVTTVVFRRFRQPVVLGYLLAGLLVGPHVTPQLVTDVDLIHTLSELGVILLMFSLGLEFSLRKLAAVAPTSGIVALIECSLTMWLGYVVGWLLGWTGTERVFAGAIVAISSTTVVVKVFAEQKIRGRITDLVLGILVAEDVIAIVLVAMLTTYVSGRTPSAESFAMTIGRLGGFLVALVLCGLFLVPRAIRWVARMNARETVVVVTIGVCFAFALLARAAGYSVALGAFIGGALVAESGLAKQLQPLIEPVRDVFVAIFFVSIGMLIDPNLIAAHWGAVLALSGAVIAGKLFGVTAGAFLIGSGVRPSVQAGMSLAQIGEFSFIIASVGVAARAVDPSLYPVAVAVSAITGLLTPWLIRASGPVAAIIDRRMPHAFQTYAALYASWIQHLRSGQAATVARGSIRRSMWLLALDGLLVILVVVFATLARRWALEWWPALATLGTGTLNFAIVIVAVVLAAPFVLGALRTSRALGLRLASQALPPPTATNGGVDLSAAPRRALVVTLQITILLAIGIPVVAVTQPLLPAVPLAAVLAVAVLALIIPLWRSATDLHGHARAGAQVIAQAIASQMKSADRARITATTTGAYPAHTTSASVAAGTSAAHSVPMANSPGIDRLLPGLGDPRPVRLGPGTSAIGRSLKSLNLRGVTGATVLAIEDRQTGQFVLPTGDEVLAADQVLVLAGARDAMRAAVRFLDQPADATRVPSFVDDADSAAASSPTEAAPRLPSDDPK